MGLDLLFGKALTMVERAMDLRSVQHSRLVSNAVNIDTPGYRPFATEIDAELARLDRSGPQTGLSKTHPAHMGSTTETDGTATTAASRETDSVFGRRMDRNEVDLERNMAELQENQLMYNALAQIASNKFRSLKDVIKGGA